MDGRSTSVSSQARSSDGPNSKAAMLGPATVPSRPSYEGRLNAREATRHEPRAGTRLWLNLHGMDEWTNHRIATTSDTPVKRDTKFCTQTIFGAYGGLQTVRLSIELAQFEPIRSRFW